MSEEAKETQDKPEEKKPKGMGLKTISLGSYQPDQKTMEGFEDRVRKDIEQGMKK